MNAQELVLAPAGYGFGSYCFSDDCLHFVTFLPNVAHRPGLLPNLYFSAATGSMDTDLANGGCF